MLTNEFVSDGKDEKTTMNSDVARNMAATGRLCTKVEPKNLPVASEDGIADYYSYYAQIRITARCA